MRVTIGLLIWNIGVWVAGIGNKIADSGYTPPEDEGVSPQEALENIVNQRVAEELTALAIEELEFASDHVATAA